jgi:hypothetical protein
VFEKGNEVCFIKHELINGAPTSCPKKREAFARRLLSARRAAVIGSKHTAVSATEGIKWFNKLRLAF